MKDMSQNDPIRRFLIRIVAYPIIIIALVTFTPIGDIILLDFGVDDCSRPTATKAYLKTLHNAVRSFHQENGRYPTTEEGLRVLLEQPSDITDWPDGGYLEYSEIPKDAWNNDFIYERNPNPRTPFHIKSFGSDGKPGGKGHKKDLYSTALVK